MRNMLRKSGCLNDTEIDLLLLLADQARMSNSALSQRVNSAPSTTLSRVNSMIKSGLIEGFHTRINRKILGLNLQALVSISLHKQSADVLCMAIEELMTLPHVTTVMKVTGDYHLVAQVNVESAEQLQDDVLNKISEIPHVERTDTALLLGHYRRSSILGKFFLD